VAAVTTTITVVKATPILKVIDACGPYTGLPFPARVTIVGLVGVVGVPVSSPENVTPTLTYYDGSGTAGTCLGFTAPANPGTYTVVAALPGNIDYSACLSTPLTFTISQSAVTLALTSSGDSAIYGEPVSFLARLGAVAGKPSGKVTFFDGTTLLAAVPLNGSGMATFTTQVLAPGSHAITATYCGDADFLGVQSAPSSETIAQTGTQIVVFQNSVYNKKKRISVLLTAEINLLAPGGGVPTGEVTFELVTATKKKVNVTKLGTAAINRGEATLTLTVSKLPKQGITVIYSGDSDDEASTIITPRLT
jgi:hypothetical protein